MTVTTHFSLIALLITASSASAAPAEDDFDKLCKQPTVGEVDVFFSHDSPIIIDSSDRTVRKQVANPGIVVHFNGYGHTLKPSAQEHKWQREVMTDLKVLYFWQDGIGLPGALAFPLKLMSGIKLNLSDGGPGKHYMKFKRNAQGKMNFEASERYMQPDVKTHDVENDEGYLIAEILIDNHRELCPGRLQADCSRPRVANPQRARLCILPVRALEALK